MTDIEVIARAICNAQGGVECPMICSGCDTQAQAVFTALNAAGRVVVPKEPTVKQIYRGMRAVDFDPDHKGYQQLMRDAYKAMIEEAGK